MERMIGFLDNDDCGAKTPAVPAAIGNSTSVRSLAKVRFESCTVPLTFYNDRFALQEGDAVYVSGELAGEPGVVVSVTTRFRIHTSDYERVLARLNLTIHGSFTRVCDKMVSFGQLAITPEQFGSWVMPPEAVEKKQEEDEEPDEVISGEGYAIDLNGIEHCEDIRSVIAERAVKYCREGCVRYLSLQNGKGCAYVKGTKWYRVDFCFSDGMMTDIYCDCPYPELCKHEVAAAFTLRMLFEQPQFKDISDFMAMDHRAFWQLAARTDSICL